MYLKGISNNKIILLLLVSFAYLLLMRYSDFPIMADPLLPNGWEAQTSIGFFYTLFLFVVLFKTYKRIKNSKVIRYINFIGTISWEVFLVQMVLIGSGVLGFVSSTLFHNGYYRVGFKVISALFATLLFALLYHLVLRAIHIKN